ncbi:hypothetical protein BC936DRAFT_140591 [Jimgerdemannia flammicorona]|uniref:Homing endonuclease LAGLIDADG domain-containing protein n=1 Tax=Jimgerdemannia flammicorona TaxID=994334 RepID=A0A433DN70_9FUNG|nr:hypothetical protein BC936DRAFT_140591 [Jimgerdemannia flammicorona]
MNPILFQGLTVVFGPSNTGDMRIRKVVFPCGDFIRGHTACMGFLRNFTDLEPSVGSYLDSRTGNTPPGRQGDNGPASRGYYNISFFTRSLSCLNKFRELFYPLGVKIVPPCIGEFLTELGLAI